MQRGTSTFRGIPRFRATARARALMEVVVPVEGDVMEVVVLIVVQIRPDEPSNIPSLSAVEVLHAPQSVCAKDDAPENICFMLVTLEHLDSR